MFYLLWRHHLPANKKSSSLLNLFFSCTNEVKTCGLLQQLILLMLRDLILQPRDSHLLNGDPPLQVKNSKIKKGKIKLRKKFPQYQGWKNIILHIQISLVQNLSSNWKFWFFRPNLPKKVFPIKTKKVKIINEVRIFKSVLVLNFCLNWQFWFCWPDLPKKSFSGLKQKKSTPHIFKIIQHI